MFRSNVASPKTPNVIGQEVLNRCLNNIFAKFHSGPCRHIAFANSPMCFSVSIGERIGIIKFGSQVDLLLDNPDIKISVKVGDEVKAGLTILAEY